MRCPFCSNEDSLKLKIQGQLKIIQQLEEDEFVINVVQDLQLLKEYN